MKRMRTKIIMFFCIIWSSFVMVGCSAGSTVDTKMTINADESGIREMYINIDRSVFDEYFMGDIEHLNELIAYNCPQELLWEYNETDGVENFYFCLEFNDLNDYKQKVKSITGDEKEINISVPDSIWANGVYIEENFDSLMLLEWLKTAIVENGYVTESNASMIFNTGNTEVIFGEESNYTSSYIYLDKIEYLEIDSIDFLMNLKEIGTYDAEIVFNVPQKSMSKKGDEIIAYFDSFLESGLKVEKTEENGTSFSISKEEMDVFEMEQFLKTIFGEENASVVETNVDDMFSPFMFNQYFVQNIGLSEYLVGENVYTECNFFVNMQDGLKCYVAEDAKYRNDGVRVYTDTNENAKYDNYTLIYSQNYKSGSINFPLLVQKEYQVNQLDVTTKKNFLGTKWVRTSTFLFENTPTEKEIEEILLKLGNKINLEEIDAIENASEESQEVSEEVSEAADTEDDKILEGTSSEKNEKIVKFESSISDENVFSISVIQKGNVNIIKETTKQLLGDDGNLAYGIDTGFWKVKKQEAFIEEIDYTNFFDTVPEGFVMNYKTKLGMLSGKDYSNYSEENAIMKSGILEVNTNVPYIDLEYAGTKIDIFAILFWILIVGGAISVLFLLKKLDVFAKVMRPSPIVANKIETDNSTEISKEGSVETKEPQVLYCENCGAPISENALFCENCGKKF